MDSPSSLLEIFQRHTGRLIDKWDHYFPIYERHFGRFRHQPIRILEIGVYHGGSLQLWKDYFGTEASVVGIDIDPRCAAYAEEGIDIEIGDQADPTFWNSMIAKYGDFEIIIDDGSHWASHQLRAFASLWPHLRNHGVYLVEDCHCAYWPSHQGGIGAPNTFVDFAKHRIDDLHAFWSQDPAAFQVNNFTREIGSLTFYDSVVVLEKALREGPPTQMMAGVPSRIMTEGERATLLRTHIGRRGG